MDRSSYLDRRLSGLFDELADARTPDYLEAAIERASSRAQRPSWTFPERWLPMADITSRPAVVPRVPFRAIGVALVIIALLLAAVAVYVGSNQTRLPAPFGAAANGVIAFADSTGAIVTANPVTGESTVVVPGSGHERPTFSPDGTRLVFLLANAGAYDVVVTDPLGQAQRTITTEPLTSVDYLTWSPDGASVVAIVPSGQVLFFDASRTAPPRVLTDPVGTPVTITPTTSGLHAQILFRPPAGNEILFVGRNGTSLGLYAIGADGKGLRTIIDAATAGPTIASLEVPEWSPDGTRVVVSISALGEGDQRKLWIVNADGTGLRPLTQGPDARDEGHLQWSPDGTKVAFGRWIYAADGGVDVRPLTIVNVETGSETEIGEASNDGFNGWTWSPDGRSILSVPAASGRILVLPVHPSALPGTLPDWNSAGAPSWQRTVFD